MFRHRHRSHPVWQALCLLVLAGCTSTVPAHVAARKQAIAPTPSPAAAAADRTDEDRADDAEPFAVHALYVLPSDAKDRKLDTDGTITRSIEAMDRWIKQQTGGATLRFDRYKGKPDVTFLRLRRTDADLTSAGVDAISQLHLAVAAAGFNDPRKIYLYYYEGGAGVPKDIAGVTDVNASCLFLGNAGELPDDGQDMSGVDIAVLHELMHAQDLVPTCAPHVSDDGAHTTDDPADLMAPAHGKSDRGRDIKLDPGHDDWYEANNPGCPDLAESMYLDPMPDAVLPLQWRPLVASLPDSASGAPQPPAVRDAKTGEELIVTGLQIAETPQDTYTLRVQATGMQHFEGGSAGLSLDDQRPRWFVPLNGSGNLEVFASLPRHITVHPTIWVSHGPIDAVDHLVFPLGVSVDGTKPVASAITVASTP